MFGFVILRRVLMLKKGGGSEVSLLGRVVSTMVGNIDPGGRLKLSGSKNCGEVKSVTCSFT